MALLRRITYTKWLLRRARIYAHTLLLMLIMFASAARFEKQPQLQEFFGADSTIFVVINKERPIFVISRSLLASQ